MLFLIATLLLCTCGVLRAKADTPCTKNTNIEYYKIGLEPGDKEKILRCHNLKRQEVASGNCQGANGQMLPPACFMAKLDWDDNLAKWAMVHSKGCLYQHWNPAAEAHSDVNQLGQNLYIKRSTDKRLIDSSDWDEACDSWTSESARFEPKNRDPFVSVDNTGHFSAIVWANTTQVGCSAVWFKDPKESMPWTTMYTCQYYYNGNIRSSTMYQSSVETCNHECSALDPDSDFANLCVEK